MIDLPDAFYHLDGDHFVPSALCIGPWDPSFQHGGPPSGLLARAVERFEGGEDFLLARFTVDMLRPMPLAPMRVKVEPVRQGKLVEWLEARLYGGEKELARASAVRIRREPVSIEQPNAEPLPPPSPPEGIAPFQFPFFPVAVGYHRGVEIRFVEGDWSKGPATVWMRTLRPLVLGESASGIQRLMVVADASNGVAPTMPLPTFTFVNPDMTVYLHRAPDGEWLGLAARSVPEPTGVGLVQSQLFDRSGEIGRSAQSLLIRPR